MRIIYCLFCFALSGLLSFGQECSSLRYLDPIFDSVIKTTDVVYGNAPRLTTVYINENTTVNQDLKLDLFEPYGDTLSKRPIVVLAFGGGFLIGSKEDEDIQATCDSLTRRGYVCASINYRLNMNVLDANSGERAVYRGAQDFSAAVRYLKEFASTYRIDTNYFFVGGVSAGSISAITMTYGEESDRPASTYGWGGLIPAPDLGCINCSGNNYQHSTKAKALINCWGAIADTAWLELADSTPIVSFHGTVDPVVPYNCGFPFTALATMPMVCGSNTIAQRANNVGIQNVLVPFPGEGHNVWGTIVNNSFVGGPTTHFKPILDTIVNFLYDFLKPPAPTLLGDTTACLGDTMYYSIQNPTLNPYCWSVSGGSIISLDTLNQIAEIEWNTSLNNQIIATEISSFLAIGDSSITEVTIKLPDSAAVDTFICVGGFFESTLITDDTLITQLFTAINTCDSVVTINIQVLDSVHHLIDTSICEGGFFEGNLITNDTLITRLFTATNTCDSVVNINIQMLDTSHKTIDTTITTGEMYNGILITGDTLIMDSLFAINGCDSVVAISITALVVGTADVNSKHPGFKVYPNPNMGKFTLRGTQVYQLSIYDLTGREVLNKRTIVGEQEIELTATGVYSLVVTTPTGKMLRRKLLVL